MMVMDLNARKYEFIQQLVNVNEALFEELEDVLKKGLKDNPRISIEQYNQEIDESVAQIEREEFYTHEEVGERIKKWGKR